MTNEEAIKILKVAQAECEWNAPLEYQEAFEVAISALEKQDVPDTNVGDLISRQAAIDAVESAKTARTPDGEIYVAKLNAEMNIQILPSAQPEIVRCKNCRWGREACGNIECFADANVPPEYHGYEWFCPNAERRTDGN